MAKNKQNGFQFGDKVKIVLDPGQKDIAATFVNDEQGQYICRITDDYFHSGHSMKGFLVMVDAGSVIADDEPEPSAAEASGELEIEEV